jgi:hypothetical protein
MWLQHWESYGREVLQRCSISRFLRLDMPQYPGQLEVASFKEKNLLCQELYRHALARGIQAGDE